MTEHYNIRNQLWEGGIAVQFEEFPDYDFHVVMENGIVRWFVTIDLGELTPVTEEEDSFHFGLRWNTENRDYEVPTWSFFQRPEELYWLLHYGEFQGTTSLEAGYFNFRAYFREVAGDSGRLAIIGPDQYQELTGDDDVFRALFSLSRPSSVFDLIASSGSITTTVALYASYTSRLENIGTTPQFVYDTSAQFASTYTIEYHYIPTEVFTEQMDVVDFNNIREATIAGSQNSFYNALGGSDFVWLPDIENSSMPGLTWEYGRLFQAGDGDDTVFGGNGNDNIHGGLGADSLSGGLGRDVFVFWEASESELGDHISDLNFGLEQTLRLDDAEFLGASNLDHLRFFTSDGRDYFFVGSSQFTGGGSPELAYFWDQSDALKPLTIITLDEDGDGVSDGTVSISGLYILQQNDDGDYYGVSAPGEVLYLDFYNPARAQSVANGSWDRLGDQSDFANDLVVQLDLTLRTQDIFLNSDVPILVTSRLPDPETLANSTTVRFASTVTLNDAGQFAYVRDNGYLLGQAYDNLFPDRFNQDRAEEVGIFYDRPITIVRNGQETVISLSNQEIAELIAHEAGHSYGLWHIDPASFNASNNRHIMDYREVAGDIETYTAAAEYLAYGLSDNGAEAFSVFDHSNVYHLLRYTLGFSDEQIDADLGISPGSYDRSWVPNSAIYVITGLELLTSVVIAVGPESEHGGSGEFNIIGEPIVVGVDGTVSIEIPAFASFQILGYTGEGLSAPDTVLGSADGDSAETHFSIASLPTNASLYALESDGSTGLALAPVSLAANNSAGGMLLGTTIGEVIVGTQFVDTIFGLDGADLLTGGLGNDMLDGGSNVDTAIVTGNRTSYTLTQTSTGVWQVVGADGTDTLTNIEYLQFDDETVRLLPGEGISVSFDSSDPSTYQSAMEGIRDFDGNDLGGDGAWVWIGASDINGDGDVDQVLVNREIGRFATVGTAEDGLVYFDDHGWAGETRVAGIYIDPLVASGEVVAGSDFDSQRRFQNDLQIGNIAEVLGAGDYDGDGLQEVYFALTDGTAYLHAYMHADGNIRYANYQTEEQVIEFLQSNGFGEETYGDWFGTGSGQEEPPGTDKPEGPFDPVSDPERGDKDSSTPELNISGGGRGGGFIIDQPGAVLPGELVLAGQSFLEQYLQAEFYG
ncbi:hypothetical protein [Altererythrobacter sp. GH1-8]|uniref:hypothetical protein n=1 Tax=Altererythrobacter sp. GH1-8 TaxID=3349333 RepID=UPI00374D24BB